MLHNRAAEIKTRRRIVLFTTRCGLFLSLVVKSCHICFLVVLGSSVTNTLGIQYFKQKKGRNMSFRDHVRRSPHPNLF